MPDAKCHEIRSLGHVGLATLLIAVSVSPAKAQQTVSPIIVRSETIKMHEPWLANLRRVAATGSSDRLARAAQEMLEDLAKLGFDSQCCDLSKNYFLITFTSYDAEGTPGLTLVLIHSPVPGSNELPGLHGERGPQLYELFLSDESGSAKLNSLYTVTHEENPADRQLSDFVSTVVGKVALPAAARPLAGRAAVTPPPPAPPTNAVAVQLSRVILPETGKIAVRSTVRYSNLATHARALTMSLNAEQKAELVLRYENGPPQPACTALSEQLAKAIDTSLSTAPCGIWIVDVGACGKKINDDLARTATISMAGTSTCPVDIASRQLQGYAAVAQDMKPLTASTTLANSALVRIGYGLGVGYIAHIGIDNDHPRAQIQSGKIAADPFGRQLTMGVVNLTPWGYDSQRSSPSARERARLFVGPLFSPNFGVAGGFGFDINRYVALTIGYARLWFDTPKPGEKLDQAPSEPNKAAPFELRSTGAAFFGASYNLK